MKHDRVPVPARVLEVIEEVRLSGETNMFDIPIVAALALKTGHPEAAAWIVDHKGLYAEGILKGFRPTNRRENQASEAAEEGRAERGHRRCAGN